MLGAPLAEILGYRLHFIAATATIAFSSPKMEPPYTDLMSEEPPPFLKRWSRVYAAVLIYLFLLIIALYVITRLFEPANA